MEIQDLAEYILVKTKKMHESINNTQLNCLLFLIEAQNELEKGTKLFPDVPKNGEYPCYHTIYWKYKKSGILPIKAPDKSIGDFIPIVSRENMEIADFIIPKYINLELWKLYEVCREKRLELHFKESREKSISIRETLKKGKHAKENKAMKETSTV